ncbi:helix-turn-helix domain-containing protein [Zhouia sp. PK063]|uniref:helix-turn-helix domain-containing protein n=1 Tax=Zhouia sp. PK063 TaxID=3373602 RepID=UPI00378D5043
MKRSRLREKLSSRERKTLEVMYNMICEHYQLLLLHSERKFQEGEWITTQQITELYHVSRYVVYRLRDKGLLTEVSRYRTLYFNKAEVAHFFSTYR